jgi:hypothetical protein
VIQFEANALLMGRCFLRSNAAKCYAKSLSI